MKASARKLLWPGAYGHNERTVVDPLFGLSSFAFALSFAWHPGLHLAWPSVLVPQGPSRGSKNGHSESLQGPASMVPVLRDNDARKPGFLAKGECPFLFLSLALFPTNSHQLASSLSNSIPSIES